MSFASDTARFAKLAEQAGDQIVRATTIALFNGVIRDTPVDTGRARGDWQTTIEAPAAAENGRLDPNGTAAQAEVAAKTPAKAGGEVFLTNNLPYIQRLENGYSKQAPAGMVRRNLLRVVANIRKHTSQFRV